MIRPRVIHIQHTVLIVWAAGTALYAGAMPQSTSAPVRMPTTPAIQPAVAINDARTAAEAGQQGQQYTSVVYGSMFSTGALTEPVLVVPGKALEPETLDRIVEDLSIMSRIIEKGLSQDLAGASGVDGLFAFDMSRAGASIGPGVLFPATGRTKPMYVGGYGAVFFLQVDFSLLPPPDLPQQSATAEKVDPVWAEAKRSMLEPDSVLSSPYDEAAPTPRPYSRENVEALKEQLIATMKHATNIQAIDPNEWVVLVVQGTARAAGETHILFDERGDPRSQAANLLFGKTVLTLRARKTDVDLYAAGKLDRTQFEQHLQVISY
jgi:hypothetical protein